MRKVLVTDGVHPLLLEGLTALGFQCDYLPKSSLETVKEIIQNYVTMDELHLILDKFAFKYRSNNKSIIMLPSQILTL